MKMLLWQPIANFVGNRLPLLTCFCFVLLMLVDNFLRHLNIMDSQKLNDQLYSSAYIETSVDTVIVKSSHDSFKSPDAISFILGKLKRKTNQSAL